VAAQWLCVVEKPSSTSSAALVQTASPPRAYAAFRMFSWRAGRSVRPAAVTDPFCDVRGAGGAALARALPTSIASARQHWLMSPLAVCALPHWRPPAFHAIPAYGFPRDKYRPSRPGHRLGKMPPSLHRTGDRSGVSLALAVPAAALPAINCLRNLNDRGAIIRI